MTDWNLNTEPRLREFAADMGVPPEAIREDGTLDADLLRSLGWTVGTNELGKSTPGPGARVATREEMLRSLAEMGAPAECLLDDGYFDVDALDRMGFVAYFGSARAIGFRPSVRVPPRQWAPRFLPAPWHVRLRAWWRWRKLAS